MTTTRTMTDEVNDRIDAVIEEGEPTAIWAQPDNVVKECARRYIAERVRTRKRSTARSVETDAKFDEALRAANGRMRTRANLAATELAQSLHNEWTQALLAGEFALHDGTRVTWAEATSAQHEERATMLEGLAAGNIVTASVHRQAINDLRTAGVDRLGDLS